MKFRLDSPRASCRGRRSGAALVIFAAALTSLVGFIGLVVDMGYLYVLRAQNQAVVDLAALSSIQALPSDTPFPAATTYLQALARSQLVRNGLDPASFQIAVRAGVDPEMPGQRAPEKGPWPRSGVTLSILGNQKTEAWFTRVFGYRSFAVTVGSRACGQWEDDGSPRTWLSL